MQAYLCNCELKSQVAYRIASGVGDFRLDLYLGVVGAGDGEESFDGAVGYCEIGGLVGEGGAEGPFVVVVSTCGRPRGGLRLWC